MSEERWVTVDEVATHLGVTRDTVYRWMERKSLPAQRLGRVWRFKISEIDDWVRSGAGCKDGDEEDAEPRKQPKKK